jgi:mannose-6-phosphate isomerase-like protein (cupin superfamily)
MACRRRLFTRIECWRIRTEASIPRRHPIECCTQSSPRSGSIGDIRQSSHVRQRRVDSSRSPDDDYWAGVDPAPPFTTSLADGRVWPMLPWNWKGRSARLVALALLTRRRPWQEDRRYSGQPIYLSNASSYPEPFREGQRKRYTRRLGDHAGLKNYGVNLVRVLPGGQSSARHTHSMQDEFVYVVEGEFVLVTDAGRETVGPGTCIGFPAGTGRWPSFPESHAEGCHLPRDRRPDGRR